MKTFFTVLLVGLCIQTTFAAGPPDKKTPPEPTAEIKALIVDLGSDSFNKREAASRKLEEAGYKALKACIDAQKSEDLEVATRARRLVSSYYNVYCTEKDLPTTPGIWSLPDKDRFPLGVKITNDTDPPDMSMGRFVGPAGWCKEMVAKKDVAAYYFKKARKKYNDGLRKEELANGHKTDDGVWANDQIEQLAMRMYITDMLYQGKDRDEVSKKVVAWAKLTKTHKCMHRHYGGGSLGSVIPGPLVPNEEVPCGSEYRFQGWGGP